MRASSVAPPAWTVVLVACLLAVGTGRAASPSPPVEDSGEERCVELPGLADPPEPAPMFPPFNEGIPVDEDYRRAVAPWHEYVEAIRSEDLHCERQGPFRHWYRGDERVRTHWKWPDQEGDLYFRDGELVHSVHHISPHATVLQYLEDGEPVYIEGMMTGPRDMDRMHYYVRGDR